MTVSTGSTYTGTIPAKPEGTAVQFKVKAEDKAGNTLESAVTSYTSKTLIFGMEPMIFYALIGGLAAVIVIVVVLVVIRGRKPKAVPPTAPVYAPPPTPPPAPAAAPPTAFCPTCGTPIPTGTVFCPKCGRRL
jgi:hypothetical protein